MTHRDSSPLLLRPWNRTEAPSEPARLQTKVTPRETTAVGTPVPPAPDHFTPLAYVEPVTVQADWLASLKGTFMDAARASGLEVHNLQLKKRFLRDQTLTAELRGTHVQHMAFGRLWQMAERGEWGRW